MVCEDESTCLADKHMGEDKKGNVNEIQWEETVRKRTVAYWGGNALNQQIILGSRYLR